MNLRRLIRTVGSYRKAYRNYLSVLLKVAIERKLSYSGNNNAKLLLRSGRSLYVPYTWASVYARVINIENNNISELNLTNDGLSFKYKGYPIVIDPSRFSAKENA